MRLARICTQSNDMDLAPSVKTHIGPTCPEDSSSPAQTMSETQIKSTRPLTNIDPLFLYASISHEIIHHISVSHQEKSTLRLMRIPEVV